MSIHRREFLTATLLAAGSASAESPLASQAAGSPAAQGAAAGPVPAASPLTGQFAKARERERVDFRYAPPSWQTAFCLPDDHYKSLVGERGELRYGHPGAG